MILKLFEKLNNPIAVVLILAAILAVNGFILYQQRSSPPQANAPGRTETPEPTNEDAKGKDAAKADEDADSERASESKEEEDRNPPPEGEPSEDEPSEENGSNEPDDEPPPEEDESDDEPSAGEGKSDEPGDGESGDGESGGGESENESASEESGGSPGGRAGGEGSGEGGGEAPLAGLGDALDGCEGNREECVRDFVSRVSPDSRYIGGSTELASGDSGTNSEVLYFEDPGMEACQYVRGSYEAESLDYTVILVGPGSFNDERGEECIPTT